MAKHIVIDGPVETDDLVTLRRGATTKQLQVLGSSGSWFDAQGLSYSFDQTSLELTAYSNGAAGHTALLTGDALVVLDYT